MMWPRYLLPTPWNYLHAQSYRPTSSIEVIGSYILTLNYLTGYHWSCSWMKLAEEQAFYLLNHDYKLPQGQASPPFINLLHGM